MLLGYYVYFHIVNVLGVQMLKQYSLDAKKHSVHKLHLNTAW